MVKMTNRQWLESLSYKKLANFIVENACDACDFCAFKKVRDTNYDRYVQKYFYTDCSIGVCKWLKAEHKESEQ